MRHSDIRIVQRCLALSLLLALGDSHLRADDLTREIPVSWGFGSGPGKTSNLDVGDRHVPVRYSSTECISRFSLERVSYESSHVEVDGKSVPGGPPFVMFTFRKHFEGDFQLLPRITISQTKMSRKGKPTKRQTAVDFPFREKEMAAPVADWLASDIEVVIGAPGPIMSLHNPMDWSEIQIRCE